jgi:hypothetical protein
MGETRCNRPLGSKYATDPFYAPCMVSNTKLRNQISYPVGHCWMLEYQQEKERLSPKMKWGRGEKIKMPIFTSRK